MGISEILNKNLIKFSIIAKQNFLKGGILGIFSLI